jgi:acetyl esterase/lipase
MQILERVVGAVFSIVIVLAISGYLQVSHAQELRANVPVGRGQVVDIHIPDSTKSTGLFQISKKAPVLIYVHGGGWVKGDQTKVYGLPSYANSRGYMLVSVSYRKVPQTNIDGQVADVARAINWTRSNIAKYGGDPGKIVIMGHSAGAHLVSMIGAQKKAGPLRGIIANDVQAYDMVAYASLRGSLDGVYLRAFGTNPDNWVKWSPITYLRRTSGLPPFLVMYSNSHRPRRAVVSVAFAKELKRRGTRVTLFNGSRYTHGSIASQIGKSAEVTGVMDRFLKSAYR